jgi:Ca-activated chloride channel family protein
MSRWLRSLAPLLWTLAFLVPTAYLVLWWVEAGYGVPVEAGSFRFERPYAALLLLGAPLALAAQGWLHTLRAPRLAVSKVADLAKIGRRGYRVWFRHAPAGARAVALVLFALSLMGPQSIQARDRTETQGIDIVVTLDLSLSMQAADIEPNRFDASIAVVDDFIRRRPSDRIGAVVFGREAFTLMPLTTDHEALRTAVAELELEMIDGRGTAIGNAVGTALNRLRESNAESRVVILLTDGDSNSGNLSPEQAADIARSLPRPRDDLEDDGGEGSGVRIYTVLMGQSADAPIQQGQDIFGRPVFDRGNYPINPELLEEMAETTGGEAFQVADRRSLERSFHRILDSLERSEIEDRGRVFTELYPAFLWPALLLLLFELLARTMVLRRWP